MSIFISVAAYRDPQLVPTIQDCLAKARYPDRLRFGICWQRGPEEPALPFSNDHRFRILDVDWRRSEGPCWARAEIMKLWQGEEYFLQLDSHHRFCQDWDIKLDYYAQRTGSAKPILSTYGAPFTPGEHEYLGGEPMQMNFDRFTDEAIVLCRPGGIPGWQNLNRPIRARFLSAHFLFTVGEFVTEVPYDRDLYFLGEEITLAIRAFTHGYDLFHPPEHIVWHEYTRAYRNKHWDDHVKARGIELEWHTRDSMSREKVKCFLASPYVGPFACGMVRTFADYEAYAGLSFGHRCVEDYTLRGEEPPNPPGSADWTQRRRAWKVRITLSRAVLPAAAVVDPQFWYVGLHDTNNEEIYRRDISESDLRGLLAASTPEIVIDREFESRREPVTWTVWPVSHSEGWLGKVMGLIDQSASICRRRRQSRV